MPASDQPWPTRVTDTEILTGESFGSDRTIRVPAPQSGVRGPRRRAAKRSVAALIIFVLVVIVALAGWVLTDRDPQTQPASASGKVAVPRLKGLDEQAAVIRLANAGFKPKIHLRTTGPTDGLVVSQLPPLPVRLTPGAAVILFVDRSAASVKKHAVASTTTTATPPPPAMTTVPDVSGDTEQVAVQELNNAHLVASLFFVPSHDPLGSVEGQAKAAGTQVAATSPVQINISKGPGQNPSETVPSVIGKTLDEALAAINAQQLRLIYLKQQVPVRSEAGVISRQSPLPGAHVPRNGQVLVYLAAFPGG
jgi:beta-lactam-binding protein with PASTA domain